LVCKGSIRFDYIEPGEPQQIASVERLDRTVRYAAAGYSRRCSGRSKEAEDATPRWFWTYNDERPNIAFGGATSTQNLAMAA
jgi:putative transposase